MGQFSMEILGCAGSVLSGNQHVNQNEFFSLLGPSGCGKTTLLRMIAGFDYPDSGLIMLNGADIGSAPSAKRPVNTVFQNYALFPHMTVRSNISFGLEMLRWSKEASRQRVEEMAQLVQLYDLLERRTNELSGGQQQRVALARALAPMPKVLLLDEPLSALDYKLRKQMQIELKQIQAQTGISFIFVTHDQDEAITMSDRIAILSNGKLMQCGTPHDIYGKPENEFVAGFIGEISFLNGTIKSTTADGAFVVALDAGAEVRLTSDQRFEAGAAVKVMVRPETAQLCRLDESDVNGTVFRVLYRGSIDHVYVNLKGTGELIVRADRETARGDLSPGQPVGIKLRKDGCRIFAR